MSLNIIKFANPESIRKYLKAISVVYHLPTNPGRFRSFPAKYLTNSAEFEDFIKECGEEPLRRNNMMLKDGLKMNHLYVR